MTQPRRLAVVGLGLMGTSLALALDGRGLSLQGVEPDDRVRAHVASRLPGMPLSKVPGPSLREADTVVLAVPLSALGQTAKAIRPHLAPDALVTDLTSVKGPALATLSATLPDHVVVGSHPMAGRASAGPWEAVGDLFAGRPWAIVPAGEAPPAMLNRVAALARLCGARPITMTAGEHDRAVAAVSHLPYLLSGALARTVAALAAQDPTVAAMVGPGLEGAVRLAGQPSWMDDVCDANRAELLAAWRRLGESLAETASALEAGGTRLRDVGDRGRDAKRRLGEQGPGAFSPPS